MNIEQSQWSADRGWDAAPSSSGLGDAAQLVLVFGSVPAVEQSGCLDRVRAAYPNAHCFGCTTAGEIQGMRVRDDTVAVTAVAFEHTRIATARAPIAAVERSFEAGEQLACSLDPQGLRHVFVLSEGLQVNGSELVRGIRAALPPGITVSGGFAGDGNRLQETHLWSGAGPEKSSVLALAFYGDRLRVGLASTGGWDPFGLDRRITKSQDNVLFEFDGRPALAVYKQYLGEHAAGLPATGLMFPLGMRVGDGEDRVLRALLAVNEDEQSITFAGDVPEDAFARLMFGNIEHLIDGAYEAARLSVASLDAAPQLALLVSCNGRRPVLNQRIEEEVEAVGDILGDQAVVTGFYSYGEIAPVAAGGCPELHNQTMTVTTFAEV